MIPILIMNTILVVIAILLVIGEKFLVTYGECKIIVSQEGQKREILVLGGDSLLAGLTENKINISSSCGGKAICGYCKIRVLSGGGPILPTEEVFMSREEKLTSMRLACQVKVRNDIEIYIPDFLTIVKEIVKNHSYNPSLRWSFGVYDRFTTPEKVKIKLDKKDKMKMDAMIEGYKDIQGALIPVLQKVNSTFNHLPEPILKYISEKLNIPLSTVYWASTFYNVFSLIPKGKNIVRVCLGTSCYVKGGKRILQTVEKKLGIKVGQNTKELKFSLETVNCLGCCGQSPVMSINDEIYGHLRQDMVYEILKRY